MGRPRIGHIYVVRRPRIGHLYPRKSTEGAEHRGREGKG